MRVDNRGKVAVDQKFDPDKIHRKRILAFRVRGVALDPNMLYRRLSFLCYLCFLSNLLLHHCQNVIADYLNSLRVGI